ncbi:MAG: hypothetical protein M1820_001959 [Bogoriella megaspora]|nr:MAG: hypothetical protein M1820_001959 [Bogoriella megaspora]
MAASALRLRLISFNIRFATTQPSQDERPWTTRRPLVTNELLFQTRYLDAYNTSTFICLQEVLHHQLKDVLQDLNSQSSRRMAQPYVGVKSEEVGTGLDVGIHQEPAWTHIGVGREDGDLRGEFCPIIYPVEAFELLHFENRWLSPTPDQPSKGWDASNERLLTLGLFKHKSTGRQIIACNTHLDDKGSTAREMGIRIILDTMSRVRNNCKLVGEYPGVFLAGDFNSLPSQEAYLTLAKSNSMVEMSELIPSEKRHGHKATFSGFTTNNPQDLKLGQIHRIDFIWLGPNETNEKTKWEVAGYAALPNLFDDNIHSSDHRCIVGDAILQDS